MSKSRREQETIVRFSKDPDDLMTVYTHDEVKAKSLQRAGATLKNKTTILGDETSWTLEMPRDWFRWPKPRRKLSEAQLQQARSNMARLHKKSS